MAKRTLEIVLTGDADQLDRAMSKADRSMGRLSSSAYRANQGLGGLVQQMGGSQKTALAANAAFAKQKQSLGELAQFAKRATIVTGGLAAAGIAYGMKLNAQWETNEKSFGTLLGSLDKGKKLMEDLRQVSSKSYLRLTDFQESTKMLLGMGVAAKDVVPLLSSVNAAVSAVGGNRETLNRVTLALGQMEAKGKASAEEMRQLAEAGLPINKILQKELGLSAEQVANIGKEGVKSDAVLKAVSESWQRKYGPGLTESMKTGNAQFQLLIKNAEGFLRVATNGIYEQLAKRVLPAANAELEKFTDVMNDDQLSGGQKLARFEALFDRLTDRAGEFAKTTGPKIAAAINRIVPIFARMLSKFTPLIADTMGTMIAALAPVAAKGAITVAGAFAKGFFKSNALGKLLIGSWLFTKLGGIAAIRATGFSLGTTVMGGFSKALAEGRFFASIAEQVGRGGGVQMTAGVLGAGRSLAGSLMGAMAKAIPVIGAAIGITDIIGRFISAGPKAGLERAGATAAGALVGGLLGALAGPVGAMVGAGIGASLGGPIESAFRSLFGGGKNAVVKTHAQLVSEAIGTYQRYGQVRNRIAAGVESATARQERADARARTATRAVAGAEKHLQQVRSTYGPSSQQAIVAEAQLANAKERSNRATRRATEADRLHGVAKQAAAASYRTEAALLKRSVGQLTDEANQRKRIFLRTQAQSRKGLATQEQVAAAGRKYMDALKNQGGAEKKFAQLLADARKQVGPKFAKHLATATENTLNFGRSFKVVVPAIGELGPKARAVNAPLAKFGTVFHRLPGDVKPAGESVSRFKGLVVPKLNQVKGAASQFGDTTARKMKKAQGATTEAVMPMTGAFSTIASSARARASEIKNLGPAQAKRRGGVVGYRAGGTVPVAVSPGEQIHYRGRSWTVPGRREERDSVLTHAPVGASVLTWDGQRKLAAGASLSRAVATQRPHFGAGSPTDYRTGGKIANPQLSGGTPRTLGMGRSGVKRLRVMAAAVLKKIGGTVPGGSLVQIGRALQRMGYEIGEHPAFGPVGSHAPNSYHYSGRALDINDDAPPYGHGSSESQSLDWLYGQLKKKPHVELLWRVPDHYDHLHFAMRGGGKIRGYRQGGTVRKITDALMKRGYSAAAAAGIVGNAYRESRWNPASVGTGGGGLWGFTTSPVSLADLKNAASQKGVNWTDIDFQTGFMDRHMPSGLKARLNALKDPVAAARLFMDEWERPGIPAFGDRAWGAKVAMKQLNRRRSVATGKARKQLARVKALWRGVKKHGTTKAGRKRARLAGRNARGALRAAGSYDFAGTYSRIGRSRKFTRKGYAGIRANVRAKKAGRRPGGSYSPTGGVRVPPGWSGGGAPGGGAPAPGLFAGLPEPIQRMLGMPGLTGDQRRDILDLALGRAGATEPTDDDRAVLESIIGFETGRRSVAQGKFNRLSRRLGKMAFGGKAGALAGKGLNEATAKRGRARIKQIDKQLAAIQPGKSGKLTAAQKKKKAALRAEKAAISKRIGVYDRTLTGRGDALGRITGSDSSILDAERSIRDLDEKAKDDATADLAAELKALREEIEKQNALQARGSGIDYLEMRRALMDIISGDLAGRANPTYRGYDVPAVNF